MVCAVEKCQGASFRASPNGTRRKVLTSQTQKDCITVKKLLSTILNTNQPRVYTTAELSSITMAGKELTVAPPAVSMQIKQLTNAGRQALLQGRASPPAFRKSGKIMQQEMHDIWAESIAFGKPGGSTTQVGFGTPRFGCPPTPAKYFLPPLIKSSTQNIPAWN